MTRVRVTCNQGQIDQGPNRKDVACLINECTVTVFENVHCPYINASSNQDH